MIRFLPLLFLLLGSGLGHAEVTLAPNDPSYDSLAIQHRGRVKPFFGFTQEMAASLTGRTTVTVPDQSTILLGGLITQQDTKDVAGVPFVSSIPLMGNLFKSTSDTTQRQELVVMIQPSVVQDTPELREISKTERDLTGFSSRELSPLSMKVGSKTSSPSGLPLSSPEELPAPPTTE